MRVQLAPELVSKLKKQDVRTRKSFKRAISLFLEDSDTPKLNNHELRREWKGFRSIDITSDLRAVYKERLEGEDIIAYFVAFGTHKELYRRRGV